MHAFAIMVAEMPRYCTDALCLLQQTTYSLFIEGACLQIPSFTVVAAHKDPQDKADAKCHGDLSTKPFSLLAY